MIRSIRQKHLLIWLILAVVLPILLVVSVYFRHPEVVNEKIPQRDLPQRTPSTQSEK
jgi:hypothetical protein